MKKKKLKKRIKRLEKELEEVIRYDKGAREAHRTMIHNLGEKYTKLREELNTDLGMIKDACSKADANRYMIDDIYEKLKILKQRTETDYTRFSKPSCDTCKYDGMGLDGPCMGCTEEDLKMYKPKESLNE